MSAAVEPVRQAEQFGGGVRVVGQRGRDVPRPVHRADQPGRARQPEEPLPSATPAPVAPDDET